MARPAKSLDVEHLASLHLEEGWTIARLAKFFGVHDARIKETLVDAGYEVRLGAWGVNHPRWKGGRYVDIVHGYVKITLERDDPLREQADVNGAILEHRVVMMRSLGRPLLSNETVHHIDGDKTNNSIENLQLRSGAHGQGVVLRCNSCGSQDITAEVLPDGGN